MRTNAVIDDDLMAAAMASTGLKTKRAVIEEALQLLVRLKAQEGVRSLRGQMRWEGDLDALRESRQLCVNRPIQEIGRLDLYHPAFQFQ